MESRKKIVLVTPTLKMGGMERVLTLLANEAVSRGYEVSIICLITDENIAYPLNSSVSVVSTRFKYSKGVLNKLKTLLFLVHELRKAKPTTTLCFSEAFNPLAIVAGKLVKVPVFISDRSNPYKVLGKSKELFRKYLYPLSDGMIAQTELARNQVLKKKYNKNVTVIPNPLRIINDNIPKTYGRKIISVGRLVPTKNLKHLIEIFSSLKNKNEWELIILGDGDQKTPLETMIKKLELNDRVKLLGARDNVDFYFAQASIFAFTSLSEGFPNALNEAMAFPLACIAYDCPAGPKDIIRDGENGYLIKLNEEKDFKDKLIKLMDSESKRLEFARRAFRNRKRFSKAEIVSRYLEFIL